MSVAVHTIARKRLPRDSVEPVQQALGLKLPATFLTFL